MIDRLAIMARDSVYLPSRITTLRERLARFQATTGASIDNESILDAVFDLADANIELYRCGAIMALGEEGMTISNSIHDDVAKMIDECIKISGTGSPLPGPSSRHRPGS